MKKWYMLFLTAALTLALAACGDDNKDKDTTGTDDNGTEDTTGSDTEVNESNSDDADALSNEYFANVIDILKDAGYELDNIEEGDKEFFLGTEDAMTVEVNGEDMLPLQIFEINEDEETLETARDTGMGTAEFEGEKGEIPVMVIDNHYFFMGEGHPDQADIYALLEEKLK